MTCKPRVAEVMFLIYIVICINMYFLYMYVTYVTLKNNNNISAFHEFTGVFFSCVCPESSTIANHGISSRTIDYRMHIS